jgi:hypothetical protein
MGRFSVHFVLAPIGGDEKGLSVIFLVENAFPSNFYQIHFDGWISTKHPLHSKAKKFDR